MSTFLSSVQKLNLPGVVLLTPIVHSDERGTSVVTYVAEEILALGIESAFTNEYTSFSVKDVIRGLHFQKPPYEQDKLVRCSHGEIYDVVLDHDLNSPTFGQHVAVTLRRDDQSILYIPGKYAHGFCVVSESAVVEYKLGAPYRSDASSGVRWNDPKFNIPWPTAEPVLSHQDATWPVQPSISDSYA